MVYDVTLNGSVDLDRTFLTYSSRWQNSIWFNIFRPNSWGFRMMGSNLFQLIWSKKECSRILIFQHRTLEGSVSFMFSIFSTEPLQVLPDSTEPDWFCITEERTFCSSAFLDRTLDGSVWLDRTFSVQNHRNENLLWFSISSTEPFMVCWLSDRTKNGSAVLLFFRVHQYMLNKSFIFSFP